MNHSVFVAIPSCWGIFRKTTGLKPLYRHPCSNASFLSPTRQYNPLYINPEQPGAFFSHCSAWKCLTQVNLILENLRPLVPKLLFKRHRVSVFWQVQRFLIAHQKPHGPYSVGILQAIYSAKTSVEYRFAETTTEFYLQTKNRLLNTCIYIYIQW